MTQETRQGRFVEYQRLARLVSQEVRFAFGVFNRNLRSSVLLE
jgi:glycyl-tRNA synthetase (class II)